MFGIKKEKGFLHAPRAHVIIYRYKYAHSFGTGPLPTGRPVHTNCGGKNNWRNYVCSIYEEPA